MKPTNKTLSILIAAAGVAVFTVALTHSQSADKSSDGVVAAEPAPAEPTPAEPAPAAVKQGNDAIQIALLLDTSSSMSGLINQTRTQLWTLVNELSNAKRDGYRPRIQLALYEYGKPSLGRESGFIRQIVPLTDDLDRVSEELFALTTTGGDEYAGKVIQSAVRGLEWSDNDTDMRLIFIAGNEGFEQGPVNYRSAIEEANERGVTVSTIYCGNASDTIRQGWVDAATLAHGRSLNIDQNQAIVHIAAPQDDEIARLGGLLNDTYIGYGANGIGNMRRQMAQDGNAAMSGSIVARSISKSSAAYTNGSWDLVDGTTEGLVAIEDMDASDLPENMRSMSAKERKAYVEEKTEERANLQARIKKLSKERELFVAKKRAEMAGGGANTLDSAMLDMVRALAADKSYTLD